MHIGVIANPKSGLSRLHNANALKHCLGNQGEAYFVENIKELRLALIYLHKKQIEVLAIRGGDGTLGLVVSEALAIWQTQLLPKILILRGGTMNVVATSLGMLKSHGSAENILGHYLKSKESAKETRISLLHVDNRYGFLFGCGCIVHFLDEYYQVLKPTPCRALRILLQNILSLMIHSRTSQKIFSPITVDLQVDGHLISSGDHLLIAAGSVKQIGFNFRAFYLAQDHQKQHLLYCLSSPLQFLCNTLNFYLGKAAPRSRHIYNRTFNEIYLKGAQSLRYSLDGEIHSGASTVTIKPGPTVTMLTPRL